MKTFALIAFGALLCGCASKNTAVFVTSTSLTVLEGDTKPAGVSIGYKRTEGYLGPNNADGSAPPVLASIETDAKILSPKIRQLYATGDAAVIAASGQDLQNHSASPDPKHRKIMFFGTSTNIGLSVGTTGNVPDSFSFGYKRKELSYIPLLPAEDGTNFVYPSVLASIDTTGALGDRADTSGVALQSSQFFATGESARKLALKLSGDFVYRAQNAISGDVRTRLLRCYAGVKLEDRTKVWEDAHFQKLYYEDEEERKNKSTLTKLLTAYDSALSADKKTVTDPNKLYRADRAYSATVVFSVGLEETENERLSRLAEHRGFVCGLARLNK